ncbi:lipopolysaccharide biosynthesis protein [Oxalicibacterium solurbis]|uniref:Lipopolysaccharide biosynthesis protein n=1 Tax=Oxalicibacterium solurbis TaxID=69280 RepID=A0A8J3F5V6_9BURK|nr:lipopolysaccharide biosynthesis protein [Oxalicibacterium solurbis]GGI54058.1 lipopolysaccharide biosynthesis protein [Oxalicibacterium solurbis]
MKNLRRAVPWAIVDSVGVGLLGFLTLGIMSRVLTAADFGSVAFAQAIVLMMQLVIALGINEALIQRRPIDMLHIDSAFWMALALGFSGFLFCACIGLYFIYMAGQPLVGTILLIEGTACFFTGLNLLPSAMLDRKMRTKAVARRTVLGRLSYCVVAIGLALANFGVWSIVIAGVVQNLVLTTIFWRGLQRWPKRRFSWPHAKQLITFGVPVMLEGALWAFLTRGFNLLIGAIHGLTVLGLVSVAFKATDALSNIVGNVAGRIGLPFFSALQQDRAHMQRAFLRITQATTFISGPIFVGLALTAHQWVPLLLGEKWSEAIPLIVVLCLMWVTSFTRIFVSPYLRALGHPRALLLPGLCASACTIAVVFLTAGHAPIYIMLAWSCRVLVTYPLGLLLLRKYAGISVGRQLRPLAMPAFCVATMSACVLGLQSVMTGHEWSLMTELLASMAVGAFSYAAIVLFMHRRRLPAMLADWRGGSGGMGMKAR